MPSIDAEVPSSAAPKPNPRNNTTMFKIFQNVQYNVVQHKKYVKEMTKLYKKLDQDSFRESFKNALYYLFTFGDTSANVDRVIQYVATFCTSLDDEEEFLLFIFEIIFDCQCVSGQSVRYRASQLLAAVLSALGEDASLDDDLCDKLLASQMQRLQDTRGAVRCRAALALQRLQNPMDNDDEVTRAYRFHMSCDPSSSVRRAIVMSIAKCTRNVPFVLERLCDVDEAVRRAAFLYISAMNVTQLRVKQRVLTLKVGLTERSPRVRRVVEEILIPGWLASFQGNIIDLLKAIRLDNVNDAKDSQYVAGKLLDSLFKRLPISELLEWLPTDKSLRLIAAEKLNKETSWYWRHLAEHLQKIDDDETLETILPDLVVLTGYIRAIVESPCPPESEDPVVFSTRQYVLHELGALLLVYDCTDPASRTALHQLITDVLTGDYGPLSGEVIRAFVSALALVVPDVSARMEAVGGVIAALRDPPEPEPASPPPPPVPVDTTELKIQRARLRVSLNVAMEAQQEAVKDQNYALAAECKAKVEELQKKIEELNVQTAPPPPPPVVTTVRERRCDSATLNKCLTILNAALDTPQLKTITPMLNMIFSELEVEIFQNPELLVNALETVALYGMLDKEFAKENKAFFFANLIDTSNEAAVSAVLRCIVDLLCAHGASVFEQDAEETLKTTKNTTAGTTAVEDGTLSESGMSLTSASQIQNTVIEVLLKIMDSACAAFRQIIVEGLCRLMYLGHLESPTILSRLLLLWFNPATVDEDMLRQVIGVFFQTFPVSVDNAQDQIQKATIPTLKTLANAPSSSPLAEIDQEAVVRFIVSLTKVNHELADSQGGMATILCQHIARKPAAAEVGLACRMLALLSPPRDASLASSLVVLLRDLCLKLPDKQSSRNLTRYLGSLEAFERASMNKMSHTAVTEGTMQEDSLAPLGRTTSSLPQPIARSTHVVINETVEEEVEIDETSPEIISKISEENQDTQAGPSSSHSDRNSSETETPSADPTDLASEDVLPVKKAKISKGKKKLSITKQASEPVSTKPNKDKEISKAKSLENKENEKSAKEECDKGGVKRSRSQRSLVDLDRARKAKAEAAKTAESTESSPQSSPRSDLDSCNVTVRRSVRKSGSSSEGSSQEGNKGPTHQRKKGSSQEGKKGSREEEKKSLSKEGKKGSSQEGKKRSSQEGKNTLSQDRKGTSQEGKKGSSQEVKKTSSQEEKKGKKQAAKKTTKAPAKTTRESTGSNGSSAGSYEAFDDSDDTLHTIVYEKEFAQSVLNDSDDQLETRVSKGHVTIPETPDASDESEPEPEPEPKPTKGKRNGKK